MGSTAFDIIDDKYGFTPDLCVVPDDQTPPESDQEMNTSLDVPALVDHDQWIVHTESGPYSPALTDWKQSQPVRLLSAFLKEFNDQGIYLSRTKDGLPILSFNPGLKSEDHDPDRWAFATHAADLLDHARPDLTELIRIGALNLKIDTRYQP